MSTGHSALDDVMNMGFDHLQRGGAPETPSPHTTMTHEELDSLTSTSSREPSAMLPRERGGDSEDSTEGEVTSADDSDTRHETHDDENDLEQHPSVSSRPPSDFKPDPFELTGVDTQPAMRNMPTEFQQPLRTMIASTMVRLGHATETQAHEFARRLSQNTLIFATLSTVIEPGVKTDDTTAYVSALIHQHDPLTQRVLTRLEGLEAREKERIAHDRALRSTVRENRDALRVIEQLTAYLVTDRYQHFLRGEQDFRKAPVCHGDVVELRNRARDVVATHYRREKEREGRRMK